MSEDVPDELKPGARSSYTRRITDDDINAFTELSGDRGRHHVQRDEAGRLMAHGLLTATLPTILGGAVNYMAREMRFEFLGAVYGGDTLTCDGVVESVVAQRSRYKVAFTFEVRNQRG